MRSPLRALLLVAVAGAPACRSSEGSVTLLYPPEYPREAVKLLDVFTINREDQPVADITCESLLAKASDGSAPAGGEPADVPLSPPFDGKTIEKFPRGTPILFVTGYNESSEIKKPIVVGCTEEFDSSGGADVEIALQVLVPLDTELRKISGDLQVSASPGPLPQQLCVVLDATTPSMRDQRYVLPGVRVRFTPDAQIALGDLAPGQMTEVITQPNGQACVSAVMPTERGSFEVQAVAEELYATRPEKEDQSKVVFLLSGIAPIEFSQHGVFTPGAPGTPVALDTGDVDGDGLVDLGVLTCDGPEPGCRPGTAAVPPLGTAHLALYSNAFDPGRRETLRTAVGRAPSGLRLGRYASTQRDDVAVLNGRSDACLAKPGRTCENSELRFYQWQGAALVDGNRMVLTASNAVGLTSMEAFESGRPSGYESLVTAGQGRKDNNQACKLNVCLPFDPFCAHPVCLNEKPCDCSGGSCVCGPGELCYEESGKNLCRPFKRACDSGQANCETSACECQGEDCTCPSGSQCFREFNPPTCYPVQNACRLPQECGCPAGELCECPQEQGCASDATIGICLGRDKEIEVLHNRAARNDMRFEVNEACTEPELTCIKTGSGRPMTSCRCVDNPRQQCSARDDCGCAVPNRITLTGRGSLTPYAVGAGVLRDPMVNGNEFVVATAGGLDFVARGAGAVESYTWADRPVVNAPIHGVQTVDLDGDQAADAVWFARGPCAQGPNLQTQCPQVAAVEAESNASPKGCFGVYLRYVDPDKRASDSPISAAKSCRRFPLADTPSDMCVGDFNADGSPDVAITSADASLVLVLAGDGRGGLLYPPQPVTLPSRGGVLACADFNGDGLTDLAVASKETGAVVLIESRRSR